MGIQHMSMEEAVGAQYRLVDCFQREFDGHEQLMAGDYGVAAGLNRPRFTAKVERVLASYFGAQDCALVRAAGTGAIRLALAAVLRPGEEIVLHQPPVYPTTASTMEIGAYDLRFVDMNDLAAVRHTLTPRTRCVFIQHTYQSLDDDYEIGDLVDVVREAAPTAAIVVDDNYAVMKTPRMGTQQGADASAFSLFKILGPEGIGCVIGSTRLISRIHELNYSGGSQVQGPEAMDALRALVYAPVQLALSTAVIRELFVRLSEGEIPRIAVREAAIQGLHLVVEFEEPIADRMLETAWTFGALPHPVGAESRYEVGCLLYRMSATFRATWPEQAARMIRVIPLRSGPDTVIRILRSTLEDIGYLA